MLNNSMTSLKSLILGMVVALTTANAAAVTLQCPLLFIEDKSKAIDEYLSAKYPELDFVLTDPDAFTAKMRQRFQEQKEREPNNPHGFDYSEVGIPGVTYARKAIDKKLVSLATAKESLQTLTRSNRPWNRLFKARLEKKITDIEVAEKYLAELQTEAKRILADGHVSYRTSIEYLYFFSRAIGHFDTQTMSFMSRAFLAIDRKMQGYQQLSIEAEYDMYKKRRFSVFQLKSTVQGFINATKPFEDAFSDKTELKTIFLPSPAAIDRDVLMRMMTKDINIIGVTSRPIGADGFYRPGGDFWMHDVRHESAKYDKRERYELKRQPTDKQMSELDRLQERWMVEMHFAIESIKDPNLKEAVSLLAFNFNHDRGFPILPSEWLFRKKAFAMHGLVLMLGLSGQGVGYWLPITNSLRAREWLTKFWTERLPLEEAVFNREPEK